MGCDIALYCEGCTDGKWIDIDKMEQLKKERRIGGDKVRIVFWFDN